MPCPRTDRMWELPAEARERSKKNSQFRMLFCEKNCGNSYVSCRKTESAILLSLNSNRRRIRIEKLDPEFPKPSSRERLY
ncbi:hypothetical protein DLM78_15315 [Leptospira stimsonii]|uniref:Uncharacterized protein n=1 Tax=Leptospira stimsonii TaxID=2202203 RepID=A0A8B3CPE8_9LEPT|nr:hypothetical protein DLM78_15315 [Leptospira stimsonii]